MTVTAHFVTVEWKKESLLLSCVKITERHTAENLKNEIIKTASIVNIRNKIFCVVTDNAANIVAAIKLTEWKHIPCLAHTTNLVAQDSLKTIKA